MTCQFVQKSLFSKIYKYDCKCILIICIIEWFFYIMSFCTRTLLRFTTDSDNIAFTTHLISNHSHIHYASSVNKTIEVSILLWKSHILLGKQNITSQGHRLLTFKQGLVCWPSGKVKTILTNRQGQNKISLFNFNVWICCFSVALEGWMGGQHVLLVQPILIRDQALPLPAYHVILMKSVPLDHLHVLSVRLDLAVHL